MNTVTGRVVDIKRAGYTYLGNPKMIITLNNKESYKLWPDASLGYEIENKQYRIEDHRFVVVAGHIVRTI